MLLSSLVEMEAAAEAMGEEVEAEAEAALEAALRCLEQERRAAEAALRREYIALRGRVEAEEAARRGYEARAALNPCP